jgi:hypothetical protein
MKLPRLVAKLRADGKAYLQSFRDDAGFPHIENEMEMFDGQFLKRVPISI